jgi:ABC-type sugar transport systems, permease components
MTNISRRLASSPRRPRLPSRARLEEARLGWLLVLPVLAVIAVLVIYPLVLGFGLSLRSVHYASGTPETFVGLKNYLDILSRAESISALIHTMGYVAVAIVLEIVFGTLMALILDQAFRGRSVLFAILILPWALPGIVSGLLWMRILNPDNGLLNSLLYQLHLIDHYQVWFSSPLASIVLIAIVHVWGVIPLTALIILSGLQSVPRELHAAAAVDGAGAVAQFRFVTLPLIRPAVAVALTMGTVASLGIFDEIFVLNGTALGTRSIQMQIYLTTFGQLDFGRGTAFAFLLALVTIVFSIAYLRGLRRATV